jgi:hypothetical protein
VTAPPDPAAAPAAATVPQAPVPAAATITLADPAAAMPVLPGQGS